MQAIRWAGAVTPAAQLGRKALRWLRRAGRGVVLVAVAGGVVGCAAPKYTVDDGRRVNEALLSQIRAFGEGERALRPAIARSAQLADPDCDKQWELPFSVATSEAWEADDRVAWVRALGVDERLTVVAATAESPLQPGERIAEVDGVRRELEAERLSLMMVKARDFGQPFTVVTAAGRRVRVAPFKVCRGYTRLAPPNSPQTQDYHWLLSLHPLQVAQTRLTEDEALWAVLWTQGLSEEGGARMKAYHYTTSVLGTLYNLATLATGLKGAAMAADAAIKAAQSAAAKVATDVIKGQLMDQARVYSAQKAREGLSDAADRMSRQQVLEFMQRAASNRGALTGVARIGATVFDRADAWALERVARLHANPLAGFSLHQKMVEQGFSDNAFALDVERLGAMTKLAEARGLGEQVAAILKGVKAADIEFALTGMPLATAPKAFRYEDAAEAGTGGPFAYGLINAMLGMPVESKGAP